MRRVEAELTTKVLRLAERARQVDEALAAAGRDDAARLAAETSEARTAAQARRAQAISDARTTAGERRAELGAALESLRIDAARGPFGAAFSEDWTEAEGTATPAPELVRRGHVDDAAALYPLFHDRGWFLDGDPARTIDEIRVQVLRAVAGLPLKHLRIDVFDPRIEGRLGAFAPLRAAHAGAFPTPATSAQAFRAVLDGVAAAASANAESLATEHVGTLADLWAARGVASGDYRVVVVLNYPEGIDRDTQAQLTRLARSGGPNGVTLLVQHDEAGVPVDDTVRAEDLSRLLRKSRIDANGGLLLSGYPQEVTVRADGSAPPHLVDAVVAAATARATSDTGPVIGLDELIGEDARSPWHGDATDGLEATIARSGQRNLTISLRSQNPPISNALVGGAVGQGKSNLLLDIVYSLASRYSPDDLELHLLDFKRGLEFQRFAPDADGHNWLPHAKVLSLESDRAFGAAVLRHVVGCLAERAALFKASGSSGIEDHRRSTGDVLPRILLIIDEFQVLFDGDDRLVDESVELLETISRQGRSSGVHLLLSSQTTTGVSGLRVKGESIFAQFPLRISLKNTPNESEAVLSQGNKAAANLTYRGEIIVNRNFGHDPESSNERAISAFADPEFVQGLQASLWRLRPSGPRPMVFVATEFARWPEEPPVAAADGRMRALLGRPIAVTDEPVALELDEDVDQAIAVVGADETLAVPVISAILRSLTGPSRLARVIVVDLTAATAPVAGHSLRSAIEAAAASGAEVEVYGRDGAADALSGPVRRALVDSTPTLVVGLGWQRWTGLDDARPVDPDDEDGYETFSLREVIEELAQRGALHGVHLVGWWTTLRSLQEQLGFSYQGVRHFVTARLGLEDYRSLVSHTDPGIEGYPRVGHVDRAADGSPSVIVPFCVGGPSS